MAIIKSWYYGTVIVEVRHYNCVLVRCLLDANSMFDLLVSSLCIVSDPQRIERFDVILCVCM
jgi:hypothetical protein